VREREREREREERGRRQTFEGRDKKSDSKTLHFLFLLSGKGD
jgi:hypothetical protein